MINCPINNAQFKFDDFVQMMKLSVDEKTQLAIAALSEIANDSVVVGYYSDGHEIHINMEFYFCNSFLELTIKTR